jgi:hypothetical protein
MPNPTTAASDLPKAAPESAEDAEALVLLRPRWRSLLLLLRPLSLARPKEEG